MDPSPFWGQTFFTIMQVFGKRVKQEVGAQDSGSPLIRVGVTPATLGVGAPPLLGNFGSATAYLQ